MEQQLLGIHYGKASAVKAHQIIAYLGGFTPERAAGDDVTITFVREKDGVRERLRVLRPTQPRSDKREGAYRIVLESEEIA